MSEQWARVLDRVALSNAGRTLHRALNETLNLLLPTSCAVCERVDRRLCSGCRQTLKRALQEPAPPEQRQMYIELPGSDRGFVAVAVGCYADELARAILAFKNHQRLFLAKLFAPYMAEVINEIYPPQTKGQNVLLVPIPSSHKARATRGYWPVQELVRCVLSRRLLRSEFSYRPLLKYRISHSLRPQQKGKSARQRREPNTALFTLDATNPGQHVILVDDVVTTGATLTAAAQACTAAGYQVVGAVALALTAAPGALGP